MRARINSQRSGPLRLVFEQVERNPFEKRVGRYRRRGEIAPERAHPDKATAERRRKTHKNLTA